MPLKKFTEVIDDISYTTTMLPATQGIIIMPKLIDLLGETAMTLLIATSEQQKDVLLNDDETKAALISSIAERAAEDNGLLIVKELLKHTTCDKIQIGDNFVTGNVHENFDDHFAGRYMHLVNVALWVGRVSFAGP